MERGDSGGWRDARPPARSERLPTAYNAGAMHQDYAGNICHPDARSSCRYDAPTEQQPQSYSRGGSSRSRSPVRSGAPQRASAGDTQYPRRTPRPAMVFDAPPNPTLIIKNLPPVADEATLLRELVSFRPTRAHAIRDRDTGASRGFAFVDFASVEDATRVMNTFESTPLVLAGRAVVIGYASNRRPPPPLKTDNGRDQSPHQSYRDERGPDYSGRPPRLDWLCDQCNATNFSRRSSCFKCSLPKGERVREVPADFSAPRSNPDTRYSQSRDADYYRPHDDRSRDHYEGGRSRSPERSRQSSFAPESNVVAVRQLPFDVDEGQLQVAFAAFAGLRAIRLVRDRFTNESRGFAFVEFVDVDAARQAIKAGQNLLVGGGFARLSFAYETFHPRAQPVNTGSQYEGDYRGRREDRELSNSIAATALEQAQWALANGYRRSGELATDGFEQVNSFPSAAVALDSSDWTLRPRPLAVEAGKGIG